MPVPSTISVAFWIMYFHANHVLFPPSSHRTDRNTIQIPLRAMDLQGPEA